MPITDNKSIQSLIDTLRIPPDFARYENLERGAQSSLDDWKRNAPNVLSEIRNLLLRTRTQGDGEDHRLGDEGIQRNNEGTPPLKDLGDIIFAVAPFTAAKSERDDGEYPWVTLPSAEVAQDILSTAPQFTHPTKSLLVQILTHNIKPVFQSNPHPSLNLETGRKLPRPAGGPMASQDYYFGQDWKNSPGAATVVLWCVSNIQTNWYEEMWPLVIPPVMTLLDDYEAKYKLWGVRITLEMLKHVPKDLLRRTGVDGLLRSSLKTCLAHLQNPETGPLLRAAISAWLELVMMTTQFGSEQRFNELCALLGDGIMEDVWLYSQDKPDAVLATLEALPPVVQALGVGCARYLKDLIPQLVHPLIPKLLVEPQLDMQLASLGVLQAVMEACPPRMHRWKGTILNGICRCWVVMIVDRDVPDQALKRELQSACKILAEVCPSVVEEYQKLVAVDKKMFGDLLTRVPVSQ
ncbi:uncharacterized protein LACBIDRAFT_303763 [Laccaria bicolor S238N-H82]|uniref:Predicted protein n=1 Tax=Laccaria bicolor (strain S238N-H82 / ATCC MYA-4686) TaxID=486041 RepID=B0DK93_LACBS|nr:uncharacterized protein LACBIDRAFT_303763 [Laccaria bicolor S238N-H82]EDR04901.1 predicted protein [Laccaria bicolor S238N-H82]|eukprot:XP_001884291.1 predicted protein [Laccaria bicolor S238N-H82]